jgi:hypothetical protein
VDTALNSQEFSADTLRRARIALGEYARMTGIYDPVDILEFTRLCIDEAAARLIASDASEADALVDEVLRVASTSCGVCKPRGRGAMDEQKNTSDVKAVTVTSPTETFVTVVTDQKTIVAVPPPHERAMPPQPLGELPDVRPATLWSSFVQVTRRATWSLVSAMFVRSE